MSESAFLCEGIIRWPYMGSVLGSELTDNVSQLDSVLGRPTLGSTMAGPPPLEEAVGRLAQQFTELVPQRLGQVGVDLRGLQTGVTEQDLDGADVHALLEQV